MGSKDRVWEVFRQEAEGDRFAVGDRIAGAGFERVRERVAEVQDRPPALALERV